MNSVKGLGTLMAIIGTLFLSTGSAQATVIYYTAIDLVDSDASQDLWQYSYVVSENVFLNGTGFIINFDLGLYSNLEDTPPYVNGDWNPIGIQPDASIPDHGLYDAMALIENPSLSDSFTISYVWLGQGTPGAQEFSVYGADFNPTEFGVTAQASTAPVPEPATLFLLGSGLAGLVGMRRKLRV